MNHNDATKVGPYSDFASALAGMNAHTNTGGGTDHRKTVAAAAAEPS